METPEIVTKVHHDMVIDDRRVIERCIDLNMRKLSAIWVPRLLTVDQKHTR